VAIPKLISCVFQIRWVDARWATTKNATLEHGGRAERAPHCWCRCSDGARAAVNAANCTVGATTPPPSQSHRVPSVPAAHPPSRYVVPADKLHAGTTTHRAVPRPPVRGLRRRGTFPSSESRPSRRALHTRRGHTGIQRAACAQACRKQHAGIRGTRASTSAASRSQQPPSIHFNSP
jgi:hypothetical protein